jgi:hypothetical protein
MDHQQFKLFKEITLDYFAKLAPEDSPNLDEPYMQFGDPVVLDFTSMVKIDGEFHGCLYITAPTTAVENLLEVNGEEEVSERTLHDMSRELSNVLAGNASHAFGGNWEISVPITLQRQDLNGMQLPDSTFVLPLHWRGSKLFLVVGLQPHESTA